MQAYIKTKYPDDEVDDDAAAADDDNDAAAADDDDDPHQAQREFLRISSLSTKPSDGDMATILKPLADLIGEIQEFREKGRRSDLFNHLSAVR